MNNFTYLKVNRAHSKKSDTYRCHRLESASKTDFFKVQKLKKKLQSVFLHPTIECPGFQNSKQFQYWTISVRFNPQKEARYGQPPLNIEKTKQNKSLCQSWTSCTRHSVPRQSSVLSLKTLEKSTWTAILSLDTNNLRVFFLPETHVVLEFP